MSEGADASAAQKGQRVVAICIDDSENSKEAFNFYKANARKPNDKVYLIHAVEINSVLHSTQWYSSPYSFDKEMLKKLLEEEKEKIRHKLEKYAVLLKDAQVDGTVKSVHAEKPGEGICNAAHEIGASLIVIGTRGMGAFKRALMGSVSDYVLHHAEVPVLICRHESDHQHHEEQRAKKH